MQSNKLVDISRLTGVNSKSKRKMRKFFVRGAPMKAHAYPADAIRRERIGFALALIAYSQNITDKGERDCVLALSKTLFENVDGEPLSEGQIRRFMSSMPNLPGFAREYFREAFDGAQAS